MRDGPRCGDDPCFVIDCDAFVLKSYGDEAVVDGEESEDREGGDEEEEEGGWPEAAMAVASGRRPAPISPWCAGPGFV